MYFFKCFGDVSFIVQVSLKFKVTAVSSVLFSPAFCFPKGKKRGKTKQMNTDECMCGSLVSDLLILNLQLQSVSLPGWMCPCRGPIHVPLVIKR